MQQDQAQDQAQKYQQQYPQVKPPKKRDSTVRWVVISAVVVLLSLLLCAVSSILWGAYSLNTASTQDTSAVVTQDTSTPVTQDTAQPTDQTSTSVADQVTQVLGSTLGPNDTVTESNGAVAVDAYTTTTVSLDDGGHARIFAVEKTIWQANISGISSVQVTVYELDTDGTQIPMYKALVNADRAQSIPWDSIAPDAAWRLQYNETWTCRGGTGCPYTTPVTNGP